jgi:hypothetical protein
MLTQMVSIKSSSRRLLPDSQLNQTQTTTTEFQKVNSRSSIKANMMTGILTCNSKLTMAFILTKLVIMVRALTKKLMIRVDGTGMIMTGSSGVQRNQKIPTRKSS